MLTMVGVEYTCGCRLSYALPVADYYQAEGYVLDANAPLYHECEFTFSDIIVENMWDESVHA